MYVIHVFNGNVYAFHSLSDAREWAYACGFNVVTEGKGFRLTLADVPNYDIGWLRKAETP